MVIFPPGLDYEQAGYYNVTLEVFDGAGGHSASVEFTVNITDEVIERPKIVNLPYNVSILQDNYTEPQLVYQFDVPADGDPNLSLRFEIQPDDGKFYLHPEGGMCCNKHITIK